jgi:hypothetical protein
MIFDGILKLLVPVLLATEVVAGVPRAYSNYGVDFNISNSFDYADIGSRQASRPDLRIMPLGASIVTGLGSSTGNG